MTSPSTVDVNRSLPLVVPSYHQQQLTFQLTGLGINQSFEGTILFKNWSLLEGSSWHRVLSNDDDDDKRHQPHYQPLEQSKGSYVPSYSYREERRQTKNVKRAADVTGATYYVVAVVLVYGMSIVLLIASHIKRKHSKVLEDVQINKYLQEFQVFREKSSRDNYRSLKHDIAAKLKQQKERPPHYHHNLHNHTTSNGLGAHKTSCTSLLLLAGASSGSNGCTSSGSVSANNGTQLTLPTINENGANCPGEQPTTLLAKASINNSGSTGHLFALASRKKHSFAFLHSANFRRTTTSTSLLSGQTSETMLPTSSTSTNNQPHLRHWAASSLPATSVTAVTTSSLRRNQSISLLDRNQRVVVPAPISEQPSSTTSRPSTTWANSKFCIGASIDSCQPSFCVVNEEGVDVGMDAFDPTQTMESSQSAGGLTDLAAESGDPSRDNEVVCDLLTVQHAVGYRRVSCPYVQLVTGN